ncbi:MAG: toll/interleukin-1 receptor domain-containing protein [Ignavibacteria bacterium]
MEKKKCFVSYAHVDKEFVFVEIIPILKQLELEIWLDSEQIYEGANIVESIVKGINQADFIISIFNIRSTYLNFEMGAALGRNLTIIVITKEEDHLPTDFVQVDFIRYSIRNRMKGFEFESDFNKLSGIIIFF